MIEREYKVLLEADQYDRLNSLSIWDNEIVQINFYYIDREMSLLSKNITVRVRVKHGKIFLQVKIPVCIEQSLHIKQEYEKELNIVPKFITEKELSELTGQSLPSVQLVDALVTQRKIKVVGECEIALDYNQYLGIRDYELEIECVKDFPYDVRKLFLDNGISFEKYSPGKFSRFFSEYMNNHVECHK